jgi:DNA-binding GntR family transcriptional regulator
LIGILSEGDRVTVQPGAGALIQPIDETPPLRHRIHEQLERLIISGALAPGTRLVESDLAQTLGVSRGPIREALQLLQRDGFVDLRARQGAFVHLPTLKEIEDFFDIRRALEMESARLAARRISQDGAEKLLSVISSGLALLDGGNDPSSVGLHQAITAVADNPVLAQMLGTLEQRTNWYRKPFEYSLRKRAWDEHKRIVDAIISGDTASAMSEMGAHINNSRDYLIHSRKEAEAG